MCLMGLGCRGGSWTGVEFCLQALDKKHEADGNE